jgi:HD-like signal output (HDOD) protein
VRPAQVLPKRDDSGNVTAHFPDTAVLKSLFSKLSSKPDNGAAIAARARLELASLAQLTPEKLRGFQVFSRVDHDELLLLADKLEPQSILAGDTLFNSGEHSDMDYLLLEGNMRLCGDRGETRELVAGTERASRVVSGAGRHQFTALAVTDCVYLALDPAILGEFMPNNIGVAADLESQAEVAGSSRISSEEASRLLEKFYADLADNRFTLTSIPDVALQIRRVVDDPEVTADKVAAVIGSDPAIAAKISKAANSVLYRGLDPCETLRDAVVRLGVGTTRHLVFSFTMRDLFKTPVPELLRILRESWDHTVYTSAVATVLARHTRRFSTEEGMLAGILSNIGVLSVVNYVANYPEIYGNPDRSRAIIDELKGHVGGLVLERWGFSEDLIECARSCEDWGYNPDDSAGPGLCDLVITAAYHANIGKGPLPRIDLVPACQRLLGEELCPESAKTFINSAQAEIREARGLISG